MNKESLILCVQAAQKGDRQALEQLLLYAYGIVDYQCRKLLPTAQAADKMTAIVLKAVVSKLDSLENPEDFFSWLGKLTSVRCMRIRATLLENGQTGESTEPVSFAFPSMELNKAETAKVAEMLTDMLDTDQKLNLYLFSLGTLTPKAIGQLTGVPEETVQAQIQSAQQAVLGQMKRYAQQGVTFTQANSLPALLRTRMLLNPAPGKEGIEELLPLVQICTPNRSELGFLPGAVPGKMKETAGNLRTGGPDTVIVTMGGDGALLLHCGHSWHFPAIKCSPIDTTGAGDCFNGALAASLAGGMGLSDAVVLAQNAAALSVGKRYVMPSLPEKRQVEENFCSIEPEEI